MLSLNAARSRSLFFRFETDFVLKQTGWDPVNVREFERHAQLMLSKNAFDYYASGANDMVTLRENRYNVHPD